MASHNEGCFRSKGALQDDRRNICVPQRGRWRWAWWRFWRSCNGRSGGVHACSLCFSDCGRRCAKAMLSASSTPSVFRSVRIDQPPIRQPNVAEIHHALHQRVILRFRSPECRRANVGTERQLLGLLAPTLCLGHPLRRFCLSCPLRDHPSYSRCRCSALHRSRNYYGLC